MNQYVLCKHYPHMSMTTVFVCGDDPRMPAFDANIAKAKRFLAQEAANEYRDGMAHKVAGTEEYRVHELLPDGQLGDLVM
jgi:hypothetical protein